MYINMYIYIYALVYLSVYTCTLSFTGSLEYSKKLLLAQEIWEFLCHKMSHLRKIEKRLHDRKNLLSPNANTAESVSFLQMTPLSVLFHHRPGGHVTTVQ